MKSNFPLISIIVSNYNGMKLNILEECLKHFIKLDYPNYELLLIDNASTDNSLKVAQRIFKKDKRFKIIKNPINNYGQGVNLGFDKARGEYIAMFNNDVTLGNFFLRRLVAAFEKYPKLGIAQGKMLWYFDHKVIDSAGETMDIYGNPVTLGYQSIDRGKFDKEEEILSASGAACLINKNALDKVGRYGPYYGIGYEDMDLSLRFRHQGFTVMRIPKAVCFHKRGVTDLSEMVRVKVRWNFNKNRLLTMIRNYPGPLLLKTLPITVLIYLGSMIWEIISSGKVALALTRLSSITWVILNINYLLMERNKIRGIVSKNNEKRILKLFAPPDLFGKVRAVIIHGQFLKRIQYYLTITYPTEIKRLIPKGSTILDVGCGDGNIMSWINCDGEFKVVGIDINKNDLSEAQKRMGVFSNKPVYQQVILKDLTKGLPFKKKFDVVLSSQVVEHLEKDKALELMQKIEKLAKKRIIVATINGFFQFNHRVAGKHDIHLSGWSPKEFISLGFKVSGSGLKLIYKPGALKDSLPNFLHPLLFFISYALSPLLRFFHRPALLLIAHKDVS